MRSVGVTNQNTYTKIMQIPKITVPLYCYHILKVASSISFTGSVLRRVLWEGLIALREANQMSRDHSVYSDI
jgi:hypothetical protein